MSRKTDIITFTATLAALLCIILGFSLYSSNTSAKTRLADQGPQIISYARSVKQRVIALIVRGIPVEHIRFNPPTQFDTLDRPEIGVFHPLGGAASFLEPDLKYMAGGQPRAWHFNANLRIAGVGLEDLNGNDLIAYLPGINKETCDQVNKYVRLPSLPTLNSDQSQYYSASMIDDGRSDYGLPVEQRPALDHPDIKGETGCFRSYDNQQYIFYQLLVPR